MTSGPHSHTVPSSAPHPASRLRLKPGARPTGHVDGAWWPRSRDLAAELAALGDALTDRLGRVERVAYALSTWDTAPHRVVLDGARVRLEGFTYQDKFIVYLSGGNGGRVALLVVPSGTEDVAGQAALVAGGGEGNPDRPEEILAAALVPVRRHDGRPAGGPGESDGTTVTDTGTR